MNIKTVVKKFNRNNLGQSLKELEASGDINSNGDITVSDLIQEVDGFRVTYKLYGRSKKMGRYVTIGITNGSCDKDMAITESGSLYLSN